MQFIKVGWMGGWVGVAKYANCQFWYFFIEPDQDVSLTISKRFSPPLLSPHSFGERLTH